jgi:phosphoribosylanthranilate isomerase
MVFYKPAPRCITIERAREILAVLPPFVTPVGLFVNAAVGEIKSVADPVGLRHVQLHGDEGPVVVAGLGNRIVVKAVRVTRDAFATELGKWKASPLPQLRGLVLETATAGGMGGTGIENDWQHVRALQQRGDFAGLPPIIVAGGLTPKNVGRVVRELRPWAVDVSSGVERVKGQKSVELIERFVRAVRDAEG